MADAAHPAALISHAQQDLGVEVELGSRNAMPPQIYHLLSEPLLKYSQEAYNCCHDLHSWGAVITGGLGQGGPDSDELIEKILVAAS
ncbi:hypothetical protein CTA1_6767 [Colletotrichum tanaceti]|uniref:Uncharacterized protein n=1 Tax=Colletotrichum tanaceti TaxID=1306861 RepID=A0A4U6XD37_9PEZI|nr:hypothetical protein CTA1_6767 [Colletotrichum tanaceti]